MTHIHVIQGQLNIQLGRRIMPGNYPLNAPVLYGLDAYLIETNHAELIDDDGKVVSDPDEIDAVLAAAPAAEEQEPPKETAKDRKARLAAEALAKQKAKDDNDPSKDSYTPPSPDKKSE